MQPWPITPQSLEDEQGSSPSRCSGIPQARESEIPSGTLPHIVDRPGPRLPRYQVARRAQLELFLHGETHPVSRLLKLLSLGDRRWLPTQAAPGRVPNADTAFSPLGHARRPGRPPRLRTELHSPHQGRLPVSSVVAAVRLSFHCSSAPL